MNNSSIRQLAKSKLSPNWKIALAILLVTALVSLLGGTIQSALTPGMSLGALQKVFQYGDYTDFFLNQPTETSLSKLAGFVFGLINLVLGTGVSWGYIHMVDSEELKFESLTWAFKHLGSLILLHLWTSLWIILWSIPFAISAVISKVAADSQSSVLALVMFLIALATGLNLLYRSFLYSQATLILYDSPGMDIRDILRASIDRMQGRVGQFLALQLSYDYPLIILGLAALVFIYEGARRTAEYMITGQAPAAHVMAIGGIGLVLTLLAGLILSIWIVPRRNAGLAAFYTQNIRRKTALVSDSEWGDQ